MIYIPRDKQRAEEFEQRLSKNIMFRSVDQFISVYNSRIINVNNDEIDKVAKEIVDVYKNIELSNKKFIVKSAEEVTADEFEVIFPHISFIATLKRIAKDVLQDGYPEDTLMVFTESKSNVVHLHDPTNEEGLIQYEGAERLRNANEAIATNPFLASSVNMSDYGEDGVAFLATEVIAIDTSFIEDIGELLHSYINE